MTPLSTFGHGLSYTTWELTDVTVDAGATPGSGPVKVSATVTNTGDVDGAEAVKVYLGVPGGTGQPPKRLVAFEKVRVAAGASESVQITIDPEATHHPLSVWSYGERGFAVPSGEFTVYVDTSSEDDSHVSTFTAA